MNFGMSCECTRYVVNWTTFAQPAPPDWMERLLDLREHARALRVEVVARREHAGNEQQLPRLDARHVRVLPERLAEGVGVVDLDVGHRRYQSFTQGPE